MPCTLPKFLRLYIDTLETVKPYHRTSNTINKAVAYIAVSCSLTAAIATHRRAPTVHKTYIMKYGMHPTSQKTSSTAITNHLHNPLTRERPPSMSRFNNGSVGGY